MSKYTQQDVVKIKREVEESSRILFSLNQEKKSVEGDISTLKLVLDKTREKVGRLVKELFDSYDRIVPVLKNEKDSLESDILKLRQDYQKEKEVTERVALLLNNSIASKKAREQGVVQQLSASESSLADVLRKIDLEREVLESISNQKKEKEDSVSVLKETEKILLSRISSINEQMELDMSQGKSTNKKLEEERDHLRRQIEESRGWERDVKAMEVRLSSEYQKVFNRLPRRK